MAAITFKINNGKAASEKTALTRKNPRSFLANLGVQRLNGLNVISNRKKPVTTETEKADKDDDKGKKDDESLENKTPEEKFENPDKTFKGGYEGCQAYMQAKGHSEESAKKICGAIAAKKLSNNYQEALAGVKDKISNRTTSELNDKVRKAVDSDPRFKADKNSSDKLCGCGGSSAWVRDIILPDGDKSPYYAIISKGIDNELYKIAFTLNSDGAVVLSPLPPQPTSIVYNSKKAEDDKVNNCNGDKACKTCEEKDKKINSSEMDADGDEDDSVENKYKKLVQNATKKTDEPKAKNLQEPIEAIQKQDEEGKQKKENPDATVDNAKAAEEKISNAGTSEGIKKAWLTRHAGGSDKQYEQNEQSEHFKKVRANEQQPLADRKESENDVHQHMKDPQSFAERAGWVLEGQYGRGPQKAAQLAMASRGNRAAMLTQLVGHYEHNSPQAHTNKAYNRLSDDEKSKLNEHMGKVLKEHDAEVTKE